MSLEEAVARYAAGETIRAISASTGLGRRTIANRLHAGGVEVKIGRRVSGVCSVCGVDPVHDGGKCQPCLTQYMKDQHLLRKYGITPDGFKQLWLRQGKRCAICRARIKLAGGKGKLKTCVDHNHVTGEVRGLLCWSCNYGLGFFGDSFEGISKAFYYLRGG